MTEEISLETYREMYRDVVKEEGNRGFVNHVAIFVLVSVIMIVVNMVFFPWEVVFIYMVTGWGIGLILHYWFGVRWIKQDIEGREAKAEYRARRVTQE
jgi:hypothetical protein